MTKSRFRVAARALLQFGAELITSDDIALNELIKNAFDARSPRVRINIVAPADPAALRIILEDLARKRTDKSAVHAKLTACLASDLPATEKQKIVRQFTAASEDRDTLIEWINNFLRDDFHIEISDNGHGMGMTELENNFLVIGTPNKWVAKQEANPRSQEITLGEKGIGRLSMMRLGSFSKVESAKTQDTHWHQIDFDWNVFNDPDLELDDISISVEPGRKKISQDEQGTRILIYGLNSYWTRDKAIQFISGYLRRLQDPFSERKGPYPIDVLFNGNRIPIPSLPSWLIKAARFKAELKFNPSAKGEEAMLSRGIRWRGATSEETRDWSADSLVQQLGVPRSKLSSLGPFNLSCLWYNRAQVVSNDIDQSQKQITDELNFWCGGFAIYRDGFRIGQTGGMEDDWLQMDSKSLKAKGFMLNRYQTIGSLQITSKHNPALIDAANREGLISCPEYEILQTILGEIVVDDLRSHIGAFKELEVKTAISEESTEESLRKSEKDLLHTIKTVNEISKGLTSPQKEKLAEVKQVLTEQSENVKTLRRALEIARETRVEILELAGIGLVIEVVVHELVRLTDRTSQLLAELEEDSTTTPAVERIIETLRLQIRATNKRMRTVDVLSPSGRHKKEPFDIVALIDSIVQGYAARMKRHDIAMTFLVDEKPPTGRLEVTLVQGLIGQVLENLLTNSIYWVQQVAPNDGGKRGLWIEIDSKAHTLSVTDNGPGIDPRHAEDIFKPYFTTRKKGKGLGLFIANELAEYHGAKLYLDGSESADGRLRTFTLELPRE